MVQNNLLEKILVELDEIKQELSNAKDTIRDLQNENKKLKEIINKDSTNSSKPPSTDNGFKDKEENKNLNPQIKKRWSNWQYWYKSKKSIQSRSY